MEQSKGLDGGTLKLIAAALMLIDHVGAILLPETVILRCIGRLAFPIFTFFIAEGYAHTQSFGRYLLRMAIWAAVSEIPFNLEFGHFFVPGRQNVLWTFCLALLTLRGLDRLRRVPGTIGYAGAALPVIWLYNGRPGVNRHWRWAFYAFYPAHLLVLEGIRTLT